MQRIACSLTSDINICLEGLCKIHDAYVGSLFQILWKLAASA